MDLKELFVKNELIPCIVQEKDSLKVLMLAYMSKDSLELTLESGYTHFFSRSRKCIWKKGETSGHYQKVVSVVADCDLDTLLVEVIQTGPACHTGSKSCFFNVIK